ncbi:MAG TPA: BrnT family toxin [Methylotenera sp.]|nr:BrnT family toxin [Methylotenera sp.]HPH04471.1 BrnT family toxin [Methylotenera sp.]HPN00876.1 BrnT family toxin [Methylotenera sp.]
MEITFDPAKNILNIELRGLSFDRVVDFEFETALFSPDLRRDYGEVRIRALGLLDGCVHALVFVETQHGIRVVSFRKANKREVKIYETQIKS